MRLSDYTQFVIVNTHLSLNSSGVTDSSAHKEFAKFISSSAASLMFTAVGLADTR